MQSTLSQALKWIDEDEGHELNISSSEPGGSSKHGVSMEKLREWHKLKNMSPPTMNDMRNINSEKAGEIYTEMFARPINYDRLPVGVDYRLLDITINLGINGGPRLFQEVLGVEVTGKMDEATISHAIGQDPAVLVAKLGTAWLAFKKAHGGWEKYGDGWTNRANRAGQRAMSLLTVKSAPQPQEQNMSWRLANSIKTLLDQVNAMDPHRRKDNDGGIGDEAHAARTSDHNPYIKVRGIGVVRAFDFTHAPETGFDAYAFAEMLLANKDYRVRYIISNHKIASGKDGPSPWTWRPYTGPNAHDHHTHVSVTEKEAEFDSPSRWNLSGMTEAANANAEEANNYVAPLTTLRVGARGEIVKKMQAGIGLTGDAIDGFFGPNTKKKLIEYQKNHNLGADGVCGPMTWKAIG
jgi:lysozyme family protein